MPASISVLGAGEPLLGVAVGQQTQRTAALDDREHLEAAVLAHEVRDGGMAGLVRRDGLAIGVGVDDRLLHADLLVELRLHHVVEVHLAAAFAQRHQERLVEEVFDHHRGVAERLVGDALTGVLIVELLVVALAVQEVVDQLHASLLRRHIEVQPPVESPGSHQRRVE